jgi:hypothetical protein
MPVIFSDPLKRYRILKENNRLTKQFILHFYKKWVKTIDPTGSFTDLKKRKGFTDEASAKREATKIIANITSLGSQADNLDSNTRTQIIALSSELQSLGVNTADLLNTALKTALLGFCPLETLKSGEEIAEKLTDYQETTLQYFIDEYENDLTEQKNRTHPITVRDLNNSLKGLGKIKVKTLLSVQLGIDAIKPILQDYVNRPEVKRSSSLQTQRSRLRQLFIYMQPITQVPTNEVMDKLTTLKTYKLAHSLKGQKPDYAFRTSEFLLLIKFFSQKQYLDPLYPILMGLMGSRRQMYEEMRWDYIDFDANEINIPSEITKRGRQGDNKTPISFSIDVIKNLRGWLQWGLAILEEHSAKRDLVRIKSRETIAINANKCLTKYKHLFKCRPSDGDSFNWESVCHNSFRNSFLTYGLTSPEISKLDVSIISNDFKTHKAYISTGVAKRKLESKLFFSITPSYLGLVDLENGIIDTEFLYAPLSRKLALLAKSYKLSKISDKFQTYFSIFLDKGFDEYYLMELIDACNTPLPNTFVNSDPHSRDQYTEESENAELDPYLEAQETLKPFLASIEGMF